MLRITHLKWLLSLLIPAGAYFAVQTAVQADPSLNPHLPMFFAITLWAITVWATDILPAVPSAAAMTFLYLLCNVAPAPVIFGAWGAFLPWICFGALILSEALEQTGLTRRLALQLMHLVGATFTRIVVSLMTVGMFMAFLLPDIMCRVIIFVAIAHGLVMALELDPKSRISSAIIMAGFCSATSPGYGFLTGTEMSLIAMDQIKSIITIPTWGEYALANLPLIILYCCFSIFMCVKIIPGKEHIPHEDHLKEVVAERLRDMGPMTTQEWKLLILMICAITGLLTSKWHGLNGYFLYALIAICCYLPWIGLASFENVRKLNVGFLVFIVAPGHGIRCCPSRRGQVVRLTGGTAHRRPVPDLAGTQLLSLCCGSQFHADPAGRRLCPVPALGRDSAACEHESPAHALLLPLWTGSIHLPLRIRPVHVYLQYWLYYT